MLVVRSLLFNLAFYLNTAAWCLVALPALLMPYRAILWIADAWGRSSLWLLRVIAGTRVEIRGRERIPKGGLLVASKHQSALETFTFATIFPNLTFILKRELMWIPLFGWAMARAGMVPIDRSAGSAALARMNAKAGERTAAGRQVIIYPEGTRRPPGAPPAYKYGVAHLYQNLGVPCLPVALNTGLFWPRRSFLRRPGTVVIEILEPIPPGLDRDAFFDLLKTRIEEASNRLLREGQDEPSSPPPVNEPSTPSAERR